MTISDPVGAEWRKSTRSGGGNDCVELVVRVDGAAVRDSKNTAAGTLAFADGEWRTFVGTVKTGELDQA